MSWTVRSAATEWYFSGKRVGFQHNPDKNAAIRGKNTNWKPLLNSSGDF